VIHHGADRSDGQPATLCLVHVDKQNGEAIGSADGFGFRLRACKKKHQIGVFGPTGPDLLPIDDIDIAFAARRRRYRGRIGPARGLRHAESLQPQFPISDFWQIGGFLCFAAMTQQRAHDVHLRMAGGAVAAGAVYFLENSRGR
jgi:hypothetical protein